MAEQPGLIGSTFKHLDSLESLRHRIIHGYRSANPELIASGSQFIDAILTHHGKVFGQMMIPLRDGTSTPLGNVLTQRPASGRGIPIQKNYESLEQCFEIKETDVRGHPPDRSIIPALEKIVKKLS